MASPSDSWFYLAGNRPTGPLSAEQLRAAIAAGVVRPETLVRSANWKHWCPAAQVPDLFPSAVAMPPGRASTPSPPGQLPPAKPGPPPKFLPTQAGAASLPEGGWFYLAGDQPVGPLTAEQLRTLVAAGLVHAETMIGNAAWSQWRQAAQVSGLLPAFPAPPSPGGAPPPASLAAAFLQTPPAGPPTAPPSPPPPVIAVKPAAEFDVQAAEPARPATAKSPQGQRRKKQSPRVMVAVVAGFLLVCAAVGVATWMNVSSRPAPPPKPVARVPKEPEADEPFEWSRYRGKERPAEEGDTDYGMRAWNGEEEASYNRAAYELSTPPTPHGRIDELVFAKWKELGIEPANPCSDAVFLRRVYLDAIGTLPTAEEARTFLNDKSPDKRAKLIDAVLQRPEFADFWAMKWCDLLRVKAEFPINLWPNAAQAYHRWIRHSIETNMPYDQFVRELLTSSGSNFRTPQVNFYRALQSKDPKGIAQAVALTFMGTRAEKWPEERLAGMSAFFLKIGYKPTGEWKEEIVIFDPFKTPAPPPPDPKKPDRKPKPIPPPKPVFPDGTAAEIPPGKDPRVVFADWLITPQNPWFARQIVNRVWCWLVGRGIVHEPDDVRPDNRPSNPELLNFLAEELVRSKYDLKHIYRLILNSSTYQLSPISRSKHPQAAAQFASYTVRRLEAEVLIDALNQITETTESYSSIIPEPYTFIPENRRAIALPDGSISSSFLELFGRPPRDSGMESERNNRVTAAQRLHLLNSSHIRNKLTNGPGLKKLQEGNSTENLYLAILSRFPGEGEGSGDNLAWTLVNSTEFLFRH